MSRIYEALQKAEAERGQAAHTGQSQQDRAGGLPISRTDDALTPFSAATALAELEEPVPSYEPLPPAAEVGAVTTALDLDRIIMKPWSPSIRQLPALQERGVAIEQFRSLRSHLYELRETQPLKTILVTSGLPQEGKSFIATNLAFSLSRNKRGRILLIDGDMRRYTVHQLLGCDSEPGLADYLAGRAGAVEIMQRNALKTVALTSDGGPSSTGAAPSTVPMPYLTFIAGGNGGDRAADLSNNNRFEELISTVSPLFDWIIVDSSPVLPVADAVNLSRACDGVLIVARSGVTQLEDAQRTQAELKAANVLGVVLNAVTDASAESYQGYGYGYGHNGKKNNRDKGERARPPQNASAR